MTSGDNLLLTSKDYDRIKELEKEIKHFMGVGRYFEQNLCQTELNELNERRKIRTSAQLIAYLKPKALIARDTIEALRNDGVPSHLAEQIVMKTLGF